MRHVMAIWKNISKNIMSVIVVIYFSILLAQSTCAYDKFTNFTIYEVTAFNARERGLLYYLHVRNEMIVFINGITNEAAIPMDIIVDGCCTKFFEEKLKDNDIEYIKVDNGKLIKNKNDLYIRQATYTNYRMPNITAAFHTWKTLLQWVEIKMKKFPMLGKIRIATTYENRDVYAIKLSSGRKNSAIFLMGGEDARDWMSPAILINFIDYALEQKFNVDLLIKHHDVYIVPVLNPDGLEYSIMKDTNETSHTFEDSYNSFKITFKEKFWSRNRKVYFPKKMCSKNASAIGINIDRNWYFSKDIIRDEECDPVYSGSQSLSEEETAGLAKFLDSIALQMLAFINLRGFQRLVTIPYGYHTEYCNNYPVLMDILSSVQERIVEEHKNPFFYGTTAAYLYNFSGNVADWVKKKLNTPVVYTIYLGSEDYILPSATDIQPLTNEFSTMMKEITLLASSIYSPLFSKQVTHSIQIVVIILNVVTTMKLYTL